MGVVEKFCLFGVQNNENGVPYLGTPLKKTRKSLESRVCVDEMDETNKTDKIGTVLVDAISHVFSMRMPTLNLSARPKLRITLISRMASAYIFLSYFTNGHL